MPDFYGTAISIDEAGNFLIGHYFVQTELSSRVWSVYVPSTGEIKHFDLGYPNDMKAEEYVDGITSYTGLGRIDCVGRVLGDLTDQAVFYIAPYGQSYAQNIRIVFAYGDGDGSLENASLDGTEYIGTYLGSSNGQNIVQPGITDLNDFGDTLEDHAKTYILCSGEGGQYDVISAYWSSPFATACSAMQAAWRLNLSTENNGFDTFVIDGHRYFIHGTSTNKANNSRPMDLTIFNEAGEPVAEWVNPDYAANSGYNSIVAQVMDDGTALIHVFAANTGMTIPGGQCGAAAVLKFAPVATEDMEGSEKNPIRISTADELLAFGKKCYHDVNYVKLDADIDLAGMVYNVPFNETTASTKIVHFDGQNHVIRNLSCTQDEAGAQNGSVFGSLQGSVKNLGVENADIDIAWYCTGGIAGVSVGDLTIENCYVTGSIKGAASGGIVGSCNGGTLTISNCYSQANMADEVGGHSAGIVGRANADLVINNAYASGSVSAKIKAAGIVNVNTAKSVTLNNVIAWNPSVSSDDTAAPAVTGDATTNNVIFFNGMTLNGEPVDSGSDAATLQSTATAWDAYSNELVNGYPVLAWQKGGSSAVTDIEIDNSDAPAVYYNLQGIEVANPENGIFIVRRGNKVTKEVIR